LKNSVIEFAGVAPSRKPERTEAKTSEPRRGERCNLTVTSTSDVKQNYCDISGRENLNRNIQIQRETTGMKK